MEDRSPRRETGDHLVLYDGDCGLCSRAVRFVVRHDRQGRFAFASLQGHQGRSALRRLGKTADRLDTAYLVADHRTAPRLLDRSRAVLFVLSRLPPPWRWLAVLGVLPDALLDGLYDLTARHRRRVFGRRQACPAPAPMERARLLEHRR